MDELGSGVGPLSSSDIASLLGTGPGVAAVLTVGLIGLVSAVVEPWLLWRVRSARPSSAVSIALAVEGAACALAALSPLPWLGLLALCALGPASGIACAFAQSALVRSSRNPLHATTRWSLAGAVGDTLSPLLLVATDAVGGSFRDAFFAVALLNLFAALRIARIRGEAAPLDLDDEEPVKAVAISDVLRNRPLLFAAVAAAGCTFLDEILLAVGAMFFAVHQTGTAPRFTMGALIVGSLVGAALGPALVRIFPASRLMLGSGVLALSALVSAVAWPAVYVAIPLMFTLGAAVALHHPLAMGAAFRAAGSDDTLAPAVCAWLQPVESAIPFLVALVAETVGLGPAMLLLGVQAALLVALGVSSRPADDALR